jgi:spectinomycin phosphotransferase
LAAVIPPLPTRSRQWTSELGPYTLALYPFVDGVDGYQAEMSETQWIQLGAALKRLHGVRLPPTIRRALPREDYSPRFRQRVQSFLGRAASRHFDDPLAAELAALLAAQASRVQQLLAAADSLARQLPNRARAQVLCHGDIHNGNVLISGADALHIVDWDTALLAPQERDLMFIGSGLLGRPGNEAQEAAWFYQGYGVVEVDAAVVAYYRCERVVQDIEAYTAEILAGSSPSQDRPQALRYLSSQFEPGNVVDIALGSFEAL